MPSRQKYLSPRVSSNTGKTDVCVCVTGCVCVSDPEIESHFTYCHTVTCTTITTTTTTTIITLPTLLHHQHHHHNYISYCIIATAINIYSTIISNSTTTIALSCDNVSETCITQPTNLALESNLVSSPSVFQHSLTHWIEEFDGPFPPPSSLPLLKHTHTYTHVHHIHSHSQVLQAPSHIHTRTHLPTSITHLSSTPTHIQSPFTPCPS